MPWNGLRNRFRQWYLDLLRKAFQSAEGRQLLADSLAGIHPSRPNISPDLLAQAAHEYPDLGQLPDNPDQDCSAGPIFITARFRSGSTLLWNLFRHLPGCTAYYEPLNERRWFDPATRGTRVDSSHRNVEEYWREYAGLEWLGKTFDSSWNDQQLSMDGAYPAPRMLAYLNGLIAHAAGRPVLQFNRVDFRLPWLRRHFPQARIVHLVRHPRDSWWSTLMSKARCPREISCSEFAAYDELYLLNWVRDLRPQFPVLGDARLTHPYHLYYCLWKLSFVSGRQYADYHLTYESLLAKPHAAIERLLVALDFDPAFTPKLAQLVEPARPSEWPQYAPEAWFQGQEELCETVLAEYYPAPLVPALQPFAHPTKTP